MLPAFRVFLHCGRTGITVGLRSILNKFRRYQSFGEFVRFHSHCHILVLEDGFSKYDHLVNSQIGC